ncbi:MAG: hypothetical protein U1E65_32115 [Myxococcota bacterium]
MRRSRLGLALLLLTGCESSFFEVYDAGLVPDAGLVDAGSGCAAYATRHQSFDSSQMKETRLLLPTHSQDALLLSVDDPPRFFRYDAHGSFTALSDGGGFDFIPRDGIVADDGQLLLFGSGGKIYTASVSLERPRLLSTSTLGLDLTYVDGFAGRTSTTVFIMAMSDGSSGTLLSFDGARLRRWWGPGPPLPSDAHGHAGVAVVSAAEAFAVPKGGACAQRPSCVLHWIDGRVEEEAIAGEIPTTVAFVPGVGPIAGTTVGAIWRRDPSGTWAPLGDRRAPDFNVQGDEAGVRAILPLASGGVAFFTDIWFGRYLPGQGTCEPLTISLLSNLSGVRSAARVGDQFVMAGVPAGQAVLGFVEPSNK